MAPSAVAGVLEGVAAFAAAACQAVVSVAAVAVLAVILEAAAATVNRRWHASLFIFPDRRLSKAHDPL